MADEIVDILIIGGGPLSGSFLESQSENLSITCLEQGNWMNAANYPSSSLNWEIDKKNKYHVSPNVRKLKGDYPVNDKDSPIAISNIMLLEVEQLYTRGISLVFTLLILKSGHLMV